MSAQTKMNATALALLLLVFFVVMFVSAIVGGLRDHERRLVHLEGNTNKESPKGDK